METERTPRSYLLDLAGQGDDSLKVLQALSSQPRIRILELLSDQLLNLSDIAEALQLPLSTASLHVTVLEKAGLLLTEQRPAKRGAQKMCTRAFDHIVVRLPHYSEGDTKSLEASLPVGSFVDCSVTPTCGLASADNIIGLEDDPAQFYHPDRFSAQLIWFHSGFVEYRFPQMLRPGVQATDLALSLELCSEAPLHHSDWPSEITVWINGVDVGTWLSPADFGGQPGRLTPKWWSLQSSQYGMRKVWRVTESGSTIDGLRSSDATLEDLSLHDLDYVSVRIGIKEDARYVGGLNIFGAKFGNYPQDIVLNVRHR